MSRDTVGAAECALNHSSKFPYDANDAWWRGRGDNPPPAKDWAHRAARGVVEDLRDRRAVKHSLAEIDEDTRVELVESLAEIIRQAKEQEGSTP